MINKKRKVFNPIATAVLVLLFAICGGKSQQAQPTNHPAAGPGAAEQHLENGAYLILREAPTRQGAGVESAPTVVLVYDRRKYSGAPPNEPLTYVAIDPKDYVPLIIEGKPEMKSDGQGKSVLTVSLTRKNAERAETFTRAHLGGRIAMVVGGEIVTLHKIRSVITGGKMQITRCTDNACEVIRSKLVN
jgi:preprotein translocase subunit SecD